MKNENTTAQATPLTSRVILQVTRTAQSMLLKSPRGLHYPITVTELLKNVGDNVGKSVPLFAYSYKTTVTEGDKLGNEHQVQKTFPARFESSVEGAIQQWLTQEGATISQPGQPIAEIDEPCPHDVQFAGMCVKCGKDMMESSYVTEQLDSTRATINMVHDNVTLKVSQNQATKVEDEAKRRLLATKKLSLVVDLDQTIIHATVDPTVAEWQKDENHPNYDAVKDVRSFQLVDDGPGARGCWYYIKLRPGLAEFLENISKVYELHIYTMGTRAYAQNIAKIVDPSRKIFGDRILSRDESGSLVAKNLQRLFPVDTKMVVIIDDRGDVWKWNENLIKVTPYDFFVGIGDINSAYLPKKPGLPPVTENTAITEPKPDTNVKEDSTKAEATTNGNGAEDVHSLSQVPNEAENNPTSALEQLVSMGGGDDPNVLQAQTDQQDEALAAQLQDRPLLKKQLQLEAVETANEERIQSEATNDGTSTETASEGDKPRHNLLRDNDRELHYLERSLRRVHTEFFDAYSRELASAQGGRIAQLRGTKRKQPLTDSLDLEFVPDVKVIMPKVKTSVLHGLVFVFSSVVPLGYDIQSSDIASWAKSFGAKVEESISRKTTHLIAAKARTAKCRQAAKRGRGKIKVVNPTWLLDCVTRWEQLDETPYLLDTEEAGLGQSKADLIDDDDEILSESEEAVSSFETDDETSHTDTERKPMSRLTGLSLDTGVHNDDDEIESDTEGVLPTALPDPHSPVGGSNEDWKSMADEMAEFLGSDAEGEEEYESSSQVSVLSEKTVVTHQGGKKRARSDISDSDAEGATDKKRQATGKETVLSQELRASSEEPGSPAREEANDVNGENREGEADNGSASDGWSQLEDDLEREMRATEEDEETEAAEAREAG